MSFLNVPKFTLKNRHSTVIINGSLVPYYDVLNQECWRHLYNNTTDISNVPLQDSSDFKKQLPWMTLYKTHTDLLQIKLVTTIGYQEKTAGSGEYEAMFMSGFPLLLQGSTTQFTSGSINSNNWENNWSFYKQHVQDFPGNISTNPSLNEAVLGDFNDENRKNLLILDLTDNDFVLKFNSFQQKFSDNNINNVNNKKRPPYLVIRLDTAIEETSFAGYDNSLPGSPLISSGLITDNEKGYWRDNNDNNIKPKLIVYNYIYSGYVISPYDFMANFTTDYLRGIFGNSKLAYINADRNNPGPSVPNVIQVNSKFFSATHDLKDGWDNTRKNRHSLIKTPYYYNFFLQGKAIKTEDISSNDTSRFNLINAIEKKLYPNPGGGDYHIEKLFWSSLTSARHTQYSQDDKNSIINGERLFIGNYLNVNEVDPSYNITNGRFFHNSNADYMPIKTATGFKASGYIEREFDNTHYFGKREINIPRKTLTPYYYPETENQSEKYAFNFPNNQSWNNWVNSNQYISTATEDIDVNNCEVIELRNLIEFNQDTSMSIDISLNNTSEEFNNTGKKNITFVTTEMDLADLQNNFNTPGYIFQYNHETWKNNVQLLNNSVYTKKQDGAHKLGEEKRKVQYINSEIFEMSWFNEPANTKKHMYVIDIATGRYEINNISISRNHKENSNIPVDTFVPSNWDEHIDEVFSFTANVYQIKINESNIDTGEVDRQGDDFLNYSLDAIQNVQVSVYNEPQGFTEPVNNTISFENSRPIFGYFNFTGLTSSEFLGGIDWHQGEDTVQGISGKFPTQINEVLSRILKDMKSSIVQRRNVLKSPYYLLEDKSRFLTDFKDISLIYFNSNIFYNATNFPLSSVYGKILDSDSYNQSDILLKDGTSAPSFPQWRNSLIKKNGIEISSLSHYYLAKNKTNKPFFIEHTGIELYTPVLLGKFDRNNRIIDPSYVFIENQPPCIELNDGPTILNLDTFNGILSSLKLECFNFYKVVYVASQKNLFIRDYWKWDERLVEGNIPEDRYNGIIPIGYELDSRDINNRYNIYNWKTNQDHPVPDSIYNINIVQDPQWVHNPQRAFENQSLINFSIEVSTISINVSHMLINTWAGNLDANNNINSQAVVGLSSTRNNEGTYDILQGSPKILIIGGLSLSPSIENKPVYLNFDISGIQINLHTDQTPDIISDNVFSKAPSQINEVEGTNIIFPSDLFVKNSGNLGGWFSYNPSSVDITANRNGIFIPIVDSLGNTPPERLYRTIDFSGNILQEDPTKIFINPNIYPSTGGFKKEEQAFPLELLFSYPFVDFSQLTPPVASPNKLETPYNNSDGVNWSKKFHNYKGHKRFSSIYALKITGDDIDSNHPNFKNRIVFPSTVIVNCVELPPPIQVNNSNDMLASDSNSVKIVWKGYNFDYSTGNARSQKGNIGNIKWKIERFQTQLEIRTTVYEGIIIPDGGNSEAGFNLSTYRFIDNDVRIYDKYTYTISGTFIYEFIRKSTDINLYKLEMPFGSFTTDEIIICKNNQFEYGRYNTTSTNLKLFRPLLMNKDGGQKDKFGNQSAGGLCVGNIFSGTTRISSSQNIYANTSNQLTKKQTYVLLAKQANRPFR